jgi:hypothetical protein
VGLGAVSAGAAVAGVALSAASTISSGIAQQNAANYNAAVARNNQTEAQQNATYAIQSGVTQEEEAGQKAAAQEGAVKAGIAADNIDVNSGSAVDVEKSQRETGLLSEETVSNNAALQAYGYETQATSYGAQAGLLSSEASEAVPGSLLSAAGQLGANVGTLPSKFGFMSNNSSGAGSVSEADSFGNPNEF